MLRRTSTATDKPLLGCFLAWPTLPPLLRGEPGERGGAHVPAFASPEPAARALARAANYATWRARPTGAVPDLDGFDADRARALVDAFLIRSPKGGWLPADRRRRAPRRRRRAHHQPAPRSPMPRRRRVPRRSWDSRWRSKQPAPNWCTRATWAVFASGSRSEDEVADAYRSMADHIGERMTGGTVQQMAAPGVETIVGVVHHPLFGALVMFGMGGIATELLGDTSFRILPVTDLDAAELVRSLRASPLLFGYRGIPPVAVRHPRRRAPADRPAGRRLSPALAELDINPLIVSPGGATAVDARAKVALAPDSNGVLRP